MLSYLCLCRLWASQSVWLVVIGSGDCQLILQGPSDVKITPCCVSSLKWRQSLHVQWLQGVCQRSAAGTDVAAHLAAIWYLYWKWASFSKTSIERQISVRWWVASKQWVSWRWLRSPACQFTDDCAAPKGSVYHIRHSLRNNVVCFKKKQRVAPRSTGPYWSCLQLTLLLSWYFLILFFVVFGLEKGSDERG